MSTGATPSSPGAPRLRRTLTLWHIIIIGLVITQPIAPMGIFGSIHNNTGGHVVTTILLAMVAMLFTAISYGRMARHYPSAGSAYTYVANEINPTVGYLTGWAMVMDYVLNPLICTVICAKLSQNIVPAIPYWGWALLYAGFMTLMNLRGIRTSARINEAFCAGMVLVVLVFFIAVVRYLLGQGPHSATFFTQPFYNPATFKPSTLFQGTSLAVLTFIGFDGISAFAEEVENPRRNILLATVLVCVFTGILSSLEVYAAQVVWGPKPFPAELVESAFPLAARQVGGWFLFHLLNATILVASIASGMGAQLAAAPLLYGMGRSNALPSRFFGAVEPRLRIPRNNVIFTGVIAFTGAFLLTYESGAELLNFGAFIAFMGVTAGAFLRYCVRDRQPPPGNLLPPVLGFVICGFMWWNLTLTAKIVGTIWLLIGMSYGVWRTRALGLRAVTFEVADD